MAFYSVKGEFKMKKLFLLLLFLTTLLAFSSCNLYSGLYPYDYGPSKWVCKSPEAWFIVSNDYNMNGAFDQYGTQMDFNLDFGYSNRATFSHGGEIILAGECSFLPDKLAIKIDQSQNFVFGNDVDILVFDRISYEPVSEEAPSDNLASFSPPNV